MPSFSNLAVLAVAVRSAFAGGLLEYGEGAVPTTSVEATKLIPSYGAETPSVEVPSKSIESIKIAVPTYGGQSEALPSESVVPAMTVSTEIPKYGVPSISIPTEAPSVELPSMSLPSAGLPAITFSKEIPVPAMPYQAPSIQVPSEIPSVRVPDHSASVTASSVPIAVEKTTTEEAHASSTPMAHKTGSHAPSESGSAVCPHMNEETYTSETGEKYDVKCGKGYHGTVISHPGDRLSEHNTPEACMKKCEELCHCIAINYSQNGGCDLLSEIHDTYEMSDMTSCERMTTPDNCSPAPTASATSTFVPYNVEHNTTVTASQFGTASEETPMTTPMAETTHAGNKACKTTVHGKVMLTTCGGEKMTSAYEHHTTVYDVTTEYYTTCPGQVNTLTYGQQTFTHTHSTVSTITSVYKTTETHYATKPYMSHETESASKPVYHMTSESKSEYMSMSHETPAQTYPAMETSMESKPMESMTKPYETPAQTYPAKETSPMESKPAEYPQQSKPAEYPAQSTPAESMVHEAPTSSPSPIFYESPSQSMPAPEYPSESKPAQYSAQPTPMESKPAYSPEMPSAPAYSQSAPAYSQAPAPACPAKYLSQGPYGSASAPVYSAASSMMTMPSASMPAAQPSNYENSPVNGSPSAGMSSSVSISMVTVVPIPATQTVVPMKPTGYGNGPMGTGAMSMNTAPMGTTTVMPVPANNGTYKPSSGPMGYTGAAATTSFSFGVMAIAGLVAVFVL